MSTSTTNTKPSFDPSIPCNGVGCECKARLAKSPDDVTMDPNLWAEAGGALPHCPICGQVDTAGEGRGDGDIGCSDCTATICKKCVEVGFEPIKFMVSIDGGDEVFYCPYCIRDGFCMKVPSHPREFVRNLVKELGVDPKHTFELLEFLRSAAAGFVPGDSAAKRPCPDTE